MQSPTAIRARLRGELLRKKGLSLRAWAKTKGYDNGIVQTVVYRATSQNRRPRPGSKSIAIIERLESETGIKICG